MNNDELLIFNNFDDLPPRWTDFFKTHPHPFINWNFWDALKESKCLGEKSGWIPHIFIYKESLLICFLKLHSYGEYIFDWDWANAYHQHGIPYYPKLTVALPYSPISAPKIFGLEKEELLNQVIQWQKTKCSGIHFLFTGPDFKKSLASLNIQMRNTLQYHWKNKQYSSFEHFLLHLKKSKRKNIKKERASIQNFDIQKLTGDQITLEHAVEMYHFYENTCDKKMGHSYLTKEFFIEYFNTSKKNILYIRTLKNRLCIAGSFFIFNNECLYGRYWGCLEEISNLHFELCYYQGIEFCIENNISYFESGAQGEHKIARGFIPTFVESLHIINHPDFSNAIDQYITQEKKRLKLFKQQLDLKIPFKD